MGTREVYAWGAGFLGNRASLQPASSGLFLLYHVTSVQSPRLWGTKDQLAPPRNKNYIPSSHLRHGPPSLCQELGFRMCYKPLIYTTGFALEDNFSLELVFGGEYECHRTWWSL